MQVVRPLQGEDDALHRKLHKLITDAPERMGHGYKNAFYRNLCGLLRDAAGGFERGVWDYWDDPGRAPGDFQDWVDELQGREARARPAPEGEPRFLVCTISLLLQHGSTSDKRLLEHCGIPEERLWRRDTFAHILRGLPTVNFAHVKSDVVYLLPGDRPEYAPTAADLATKDYHYLRELS